MVSNRNSKSENFDKNELYLEEKLTKTGHKSVLVICAHSDDQALGPGGTLAKFSKQGVSVKTIIMSYGELTPAWIKNKYTIKTRISESLAADKILGCNGVEFLGLKEGRFIADAEEKKVYDKLEKIIKKEKPSLIFTHMKEDPHKDHRDTLKIVKDLMLRFDKESRADVYSFGIWNPIIIHRRAPHLIVDISDTFKKKLDSMKCFKSQKLVILQLTPGVIIRAKFVGFSRGYKYAEMFRKVSV